MRIIVLLFILVLSAVPAMASEGTIALLAVAEGTGTVLGSPAQLHVEIRPGTGKVFIESFPAAKLDTQISTRFANRIACKYLDRNCERYDFFYTIIAESRIIGGPSAGAAVAVLTVAVLENLPINERMAITGTIGSGEIIGNVGYLHTKLEAAKAAGIRTVLVPTIMERSEQNVTANLSAYGAELGITVVPVTTLDAAVRQFTGRPPRRRPNAVTQDGSYAETMTQIATAICNRTRTLQVQIPQRSAMAQQLANTTIRGNTLLDEGHHYSAASVCFGANVQYASLLLAEKSAGERARLTQKVRTDIAAMDSYLVAMPLRTITDLETSMAVADRLREARDALNESNVTHEQLAYALERVHSARAWAKFFGKPGKRFKFSEDRLAQSCLNKIAEAQEHLEYLRLFFPGLLESQDSAIARAVDDYHSGDYTLCLAGAALAKAEVNSVLSALGLSEEEYRAHIDAKLAAGERTMATALREGMFPVLGYSYHRYAQDLRETDPVSAMLYAEYALELSNLDLYFPRSAWHADLSEFREPFLFMAGVAIGLLIAQRLQRKRSAREKRKQERTP